MDIIAASRMGYEYFPERLVNLIGGEYVFVGERMKLTKAYLDKLNPRFIFFPHWSYIIPKEIHENFKCIIFHMTDVPFGRGGSPLQNLVSRGIYETKITALRCVEELDAGPIYLQRPLCLHGTAEEIYRRAADIVFEMIREIVEKQPVPREQQGEVVCFRRRRPDEGNIQDLTELEKVYDYIRMLDAGGYPNAFFETQSFRFDLSRASMKADGILADVRIYRKKP
jgi:methionyl-tRNA formyltransferase